MARLSLSGLTKHYGQTTAVRDVSIDLGDNELLCLLGPSGCGKTTTLRMIGGFIAPDEGDILIDGQSVVSVPPERRPTAMVFQRHALWPHMTVFDNIAFGLQLRRMRRAEISKTVENALDLVGLPGKGKRYPHQLSGGEQQRVALARALVLQPRILLLDEPLSNLDAQLRVRMREEVRNIQQRVGITTVFVTHDQEEALAIADRIGVMQSGQLEQLATPDELYVRPATLFVAGFIGSMNLLPATALGNVLRLEEQTLPLPPGIRADAGAAFTVAIRPEDIALLNGAAGSSAWHGTVRQSRNLGNHKVLLVDVGAAQHLSVSVSREMAPPPGTPVALAPGRFLVYQGGVLRGASV
jgi:putative spermidine/putrescine transport system ATP-binding protein